MAEHLAELIKTKDLNIKRGHITGTQTIQQDGHEVTFDVPFEDADYDVFITLNGNSGGYFVVTWVSDTVQSPKTKNGFWICLGSAQYSTYNIPYDIAWIAIHR